VVILAVFVVMRDQLCATNVYITTEADLQETESWAGALEIREVSLLSVCFIGSVVPEVYGC